jgi:hypothetical protein
MGRLKKQGYKGRPMSPTPLQFDFPRYNLRKSGVHICGGKMQLIEILFKNCTELEGAIEMDFRSFVKNCNDCERTKVTRSTKSRDL